MKAKIKGLLLRGLSVGMAATMIAAVGSAFRKEDMSYMASASLGGGLTDVTGQVSTDNLREQYLNKDLVTKNPYSDNDDVWVVVTFEGNSIAGDYLGSSASNKSFSDYTLSSYARTRTQELEKAHSGFLRSLKMAGIPYECKYSYTSLNNGVALRVKNKYVKRLSDFEGVKSVGYTGAYETPMIAVDNDANVYSTGIYDSSDLQGVVQGEGMVVAILDTGLDFSHPAFQTMPTAPAWSKADVAAKLANRNLKAFNGTPDLTVDEVYYNAKVPYAYDYADDDPDVFPSYSSHGTHVAGIVAGKDDSKTVGENETFIGVAPEAQLVIGKVFTDDLDSRMIGGADTTDILACINDMATLGVDVINMSLGSSCGFTDESGDDAVQEAYDYVEALGISLVVAASNDYSSGFGGDNGTNLASNPDSATVGSPSTYPGALSVASISGKQSRYMQVGNNEADVAFITNASDGNGNEIDFMEQLYAKMNADTSKPLELNYVVIGGVGRDANYSPAAIRNQLKDKKTIALISRGDTTFAEKVQTAKNAGAVACIIYNNLSGTIRMSLGELDDPIPACSIGMDAGKMLRERAGTNGVGKVTFAYDYMAGPFMSEFSSWGPNPDLRLKPEITAHGGEITSAVPGGYDVYSGTSMAAPNMAGAIALLRQYVKEQTGLEGTALAARVNQLAMSTTTMALNEEGNPYSPRKQGAGLASISSAVNTEGYITVKDESGEVTDKTKLELLDDPGRTGVFEGTFTVHNQSNKTTAYTPKPYVMTETLASDNKTVAEKAYMLNDTSVEFRVGGAAVSTITVGAGESVEVKFTITLSQKARSYIESSFENGMYVEGFFRFLGANDDTTVDLGIPFLAFYGDWTDAPLFDYTVYEIAESEADPSIEEEDKLKATAVATRPLGLYWEDEYIIPLGTYLYEMSPFDAEIYPDDARAVISAFDNKLDGSGKHTVYELYWVYAGLLRNAKTMQVNITNTVTGERVYEKTETNVRKSYTGGGGGRGSIISLGINPAEWGWSNNTTYRLDMWGTLDYDSEREHTQEPNRNSFSFEFTVDTETPQINDYRIRYVPYTENRETKYRIYLDLDVYDNQYAMDVMLCYLREDKQIDLESGQNKSYLTLLNDYPIPVYGQKGEMTTVSYEITDLYEEYFLDPDFELYISVEDYAMNSVVYSLDLGQVYNATSYPESVTLKTDSRLTSKGAVSDENGNYNLYSLSLAQNENYKVTVNSLPDAAMAASLIWKTEDGEVLAKDRELFAKGESGTHKVYLQGCNYNRGALNEETGEYDYTYDYYTLAVIEVTIGGTPKRAPTQSRISLRSVLGGDYHVTDLNSGETLELHPNQKVQLTPSIEPWYASQDVHYVYTSSNTSVLEVSEEGMLLPKTKGVAYVTVAVEENSRLTTRIRVEVGNEYDVTNYTLYEYYGGPIADVPERLNVMYLDDECFSYNTTLEEVYLPHTLTEIPEYAFIGCTNLKKVVIPSSCVVVNNYAFIGCTSLKEVVFETVYDKDTKELTDDIGTVTLGRGAFMNCTSLDSIENQLRITTANDYAFAGCTSLASIDVSGLRIAGKYIFAGCTDLSAVTTGEFTKFGEYMFFGCEKLTEIEISSQRIGDGAFSGTGLTNISFAAGLELTYLGKEAFAGTKITGVTLPNGTYRLGENAFKDCKSLTTVTLSSGTLLLRDNDSPFNGCDLLSAYAIDGSNENYTVSGGVLFSNSGKTVELVPVALLGSYTMPSTVTKIGTAAFAGTSLTEINLGSVTELAPYAFANSALTKVTLNSSITSLPAGVFKGCTALTSVMGGTNVTEIGNYAFAGCTALDLMQGFFASAERIGDYAFSGSGIVNFPAGGAVTEIGVRAFEKTSIRTLTIENTGDLTIGDYAFANLGTLTKITVGAVVKMGKGAFMNNDKLFSITFGAGTKEIGADAFALYGVDSYGEYGLLPQSKITEVSLPAGVEKIGDRAFAYADKMARVNLNDVTEVGERAFWKCELLGNVGTLSSSNNLANLKEVGANAFAYCSKLRTLNLEKATKVGAYAFYKCTGVTTLNIPALEIVGEYAFADLSIRTVEIPATLGYSHEIFWTELNDAYHEVEMRGRMDLNFGGGVFASNDYLTSFTVAEGNDVYFVDENGVLYAKVERGYVLVQYPAGKSATSYSVLPGTVRIGDGAFQMGFMDDFLEYYPNRIDYNLFAYPYRGNALRSVDFPYSLESIGSFAFFHSAVNSYTFEAVEAPILEAAVNDLGDEYFNTNYFSFFGLFYTNFNDLIEINTYKNDNADGTSYSDMSVYYPENGVGYGNYIWEFYFEGMIHKTDYAPTRSTHVALEALEAMPTATEVRAEMAGLSGQAAKDKIASISADYVQVARALYDGITDAEQRALLSEGLAKLYATEAAVRDVKAELGIPAQIDTLYIASRPDKIRYTAGETFDATGLVIEAVYDDLSRITVTDYVIDKTEPLTVEDTFVLITYGGKTAQINILVEEGEESGGGGENEEGGMAAWAIALIVVAAVVVVAGAAVAVLFVLKKKKGGAAGPENAPETNENENGDNE